MVVLVGGVNKGVLRGVQYARSLNPDRILAVTVASNDEERKAIEAQWKEFEVPIELHTVYSPYRELTRPILQFIDELDEQHQGDIITVVIPEFVTISGNPVAAQRQRLCPQGQTALPSAHRRCLGTDPYDGRSNGRGVGVSGMHVIVVGCGRVGSEVALSLASTEHDVIVIDRKVESFRRLGDDFKGTTMVGVGFDRDVLTEAGITPNCAVAAVTSGDNSNILIARVARETFGVKHVVARIYDPRRASIYERLGIATVASVAWTSARVLRHLLASDSTPDWIDPSAKFTIIERRVSRPPLRACRWAPSKPRPTAGSWCSAGSARRAFRRRPPCSRRTTCCMSSSPQINQRCSTTRCTSRRDRTDERDHCRCRQRRSLHGRASCRTRVTT